MAKIHFISGLPLLDEAWTVILMSFIGWNVVYSGVDWISSRSWRYRRLAKGRREQWCIRGTSAIHSLCVSGIALYLLLQGELFKDRFFHHTQVSTSLHAVVCGFFLWDIKISALHFSRYGLPLMIHAVLCFTVYFFSFTPFAHYYGAVFLLFEVTTVFLNASWILEKAGYEKTFVYKACGLSLMASFFAIRIVWGIASSYNFWLDIARYGDRVPILHKAIYCSSNMVLNSLNIVWFVKMVFVFNRTRRRLEDSSAKGRSGGIEE